MIFRDSGFGFNLSGLNYIYILRIGVSDLGGSSDLGGGGLKAQQAHSTKFAYGSGEAKLSR